MKKYAPLLVQRTVIITVFMLRSGQQRETYQATHSSSIHPDANGICRHQRTWQNRIRPTFVEPGVKINGKCYRDVLLMQNNCRLTFEICLNIMFSNRIEPRRIGHKNPLICCRMLCQNSYTTFSLATEWSSRKSARIQYLAGNVRPRIREEDWYVDQLKW